jgi:hypothetical protein
MIWLMQRAPLVLSEFRSEQERSSHARIMSRWMDAVAVRLEPCVPMLARQKRRSGYTGVLFREPGARGSTRANDLRAAGSAVAG